MLILYVVSCVSIASGSIRVWNASQNGPLESIKINATGGLQSILVTSTNQRVLASTGDGSIIVHSLLHGRAEYRTGAGHTDTIFECVYHPVSSELIATASYDGTIKIWNISTLTLVRTLRTEGDSLLYCCSWSMRGRTIAASTGIIIQYTTNLCSI